LLRTSEAEILIRYLTLLAELRRGHFFVSHRQFEQGIVRFAQLDIFVLHYHFRVFWKERGHAYTLDNGRAKKLVANEMEQSKSMRKSVGTFEGELGV
jgi:hypothetical protein